MSKAIGPKALAARISAKLREHGVETVLCGGSCVAIYSAGRYVTRDFDFVLTAGYPARIIAEALAEIGYRPDPRVSGAFSNPDEEMLVDIRPAPPALGREPIGEPAVLAAGRFKLTLLSPTDCVKDRLAHYFYYGDRQALEQAIMVALAHRVGMREVRRWSRAEGEARKFQVFRRELARRRANPTAL